MPRWLIFASSGMYVAEVESESARAALAAYTTSLNGSGGEPSLRFFQDAGGALGVVASISGGRRGGITDVVYVARCVF